MNQKGFTLIELLVVVAIIGILAAVGVVAYNGYTASAKKKTTGANHKIIAKYKIKKHNKIITKKIKAPNIQNISYEELKEKIFPKKRKLSIMPKYDYLTKNELEALYLYIQSQRNKK